LLILALLALASPERAYGADLDEAAVDALVRKTLAAWRVPGVAIAIVRDGEVIYLRGHGRRALDHQDPVTPDTLFPIASCTKAFTTTAMAMLVDEGKMAWDDPVRKHLPYFHLSDPQADKQVTLRDLVCHRTGLRSHDLLWYRAPYSHEELVRRAGRLPLDKPFRGAFQYQSIMFTAAGLAVASASGMPWDEFVRQRLLEPLQMSGAVFTTSDAHRTPDYAFPHRLNPRGEVEMIDFYPLDRPNPAGSLHASAGDLARWLCFQLGDGTFHGRRLVSARNLAQTHTPQIDIPMDDNDRVIFPQARQMSYGMGWVILQHGGQTMLMHAGAIDGFRAHLTLIPQRQLGIVLLSNLGQTKMNLALSHSLLDLLLDLPRRDWTPIIQEVVHKQQRGAAEAERSRRAQRIPNTRPSRDAGAYVGTYEHPAYGTAQVALSPGGLVFHWREFRAPLEHFHYDTFIMPIEIMDNPEVVFTLDDTGAVMRMKVLGNVDVEFRRIRP
jgi:CubicO group peptidase (beta-lactamase class C family)